MHLEKPILSIIIATKDRQRYALSAINSILSMREDKIQLVVQDNSSNDSLNIKLKMIYENDKRLTYNYIKDPLSFIDNFNFAIENALGEYICVIGDDDGINPEIIKATLWAKKNQVDAFWGSLSANYRWDGTGAPDTLFTKMRGNVLTLTNFTGKVKYVDINRSLIKFSKNGCSNYSEFELPKLYHGVVKKKFIEDIRKITGAYINGLSPDIYSSISLSCVLKKIVYIDYPLTIPGVCAESGSIKEGQIKKHSKNLEDAPHFKSRKNYQWNEDVPRIFSVQTIWADSALAALNDMKQFDLIKKFNRSKLFANIIYADKSNVNLVLKHIFHICSNNYLTFIFQCIKLLYSLFSGPLYMWFFKKKVVGRIKIILKINQYLEIQNIKDIETAMHSLSMYLLKKKYSIEKVLKLI